MSEVDPQAVLRALADPTRRRLFEELEEFGEQTVEELTRHAKVSQPAVSRHLKILKQAKLVEARRAGRETHYRARLDGLSPLVKWVLAFRGY